MFSMNQSLLKTIIYSALAITGGFALLGWMENDAGWVCWLIAFCAALALYFGICHPRNKEERQKEIETILSEESRQNLDQGKSLDVASPLKLKSGEQLYWADQMRTDYYNSKPHVFYLTSKRLVCLDEEFRFSHPLDQITIEFLQGRVVVQAGNKKLAFLCASPDYFQKAWKLVAHKN